MFGNVRWVSQQPSRNNQQQHGYGNGLPGRDPRHQAEALSVQRRHNHAECKDRDYEGQRYNHARAGKI